MSGRRGYTIFCDDIRQEVGGKRTWVGIYRAQMIINAKLPATLPKLAIAVILQTPPNQPIRSVRLKVYLPGDPEDTPSVSGNVELTTSTSEFPLLEAEDVDRWIEFNTEFVLSPVTIKLEGFIKVRAEVEGETLRIGALRIREANQPAPQNTQGKS